MTITKDMLLGDILREKPESADTLEEACMVHGLDVDEVLEFLNDADAK